MRIAPGVPFVTCSTGFSTLTGSRPKTWRCQLKVGSIVAAVVAVIGLVAFWVRRNVRKEFAYYAESEAMLYWRRPDGWYRAPFDGWNIDIDKATHIDPETADIDVLITLSRAMEAFAEVES